MQQAIRVLIPVKLLRSDAYQGFGNGPFLGLVSDEFAEFVGCQRHGNATQRLQPRSLFGIGKHGIALGIELVHDFCFTEIGNPPETPRNH